MKNIIVTCALLLMFVAVTSSNLLAATEKEKAFTDAYKKAYEAMDQKALEALLYTKGADPEALEFYTMMMTPEEGSKISAIELRDLTPAELAEASEGMPSPSGGMSVLPVKPSKKLVLKIQTANSSGTSTSSSESFVADVEGKYMIPVPGPAK